MKLTIRWFFGQCLLSHNKLGHKTSHNFKTHFPNPYPFAVLPRYHSSHDPSLKKNQKKPRLRRICAAGTSEIFFPEDLLEFNEEVEISTGEIRCAFQGIDQNIHSDLVIFGGYRRILDCQIPFIEA